MSIHRLGFYWWLSLCCGILVSSTAQATLGEDVSSVATVRAHLDPVTTSTETHALYTRHETVTTMLTVHEYVGTGGQIFAVTWQGASHPDLTSLLGSYLPDLARAMQAAPAANPHLRRSELHGDQIVIIKSGHMRHVEGKAYLPARLPQGVTPDDLN